MSLIKMGYRYGVVKVKGWIVNWKVVDRLIERNIIKEDEIDEDEADYIMEKYGFNKCSYLIYNNHKYLLGCIDPANPRDYNREIVGVLPYEEDQDYKDILKILEIKDEAENHEIIAIY